MGKGVYKLLNEDNNKAFNFLPYLITNKFLEAKIILFRPWIIQQLKFLMEVITIKNPIRSKLWPMYFKLPASTIKITELF